MNKRIQDLLSSFSRI